MTDTERLDFLSRADTRIGRRACDLMRSDPCEERAVHFMIDGLERTVNGETLREAIDHAIFITGRARRPNERSPENNQK